MNVQNKSAGQVYEYDALVGIFEMCVPFVSLDRLFVLYFICGGCDGVAMNEKKQDMA